MKQILQSLRNGKTEIANVPVPLSSKNSLLIRSSRTLVSAGTERMLVEFGKAGLIKKAKQQPDKVKMVLDKIKTDGLKPTLDAVFNKLNQPLPLGYCNVGKIIEVGDGVTNFVVGDRVVSNGKHAEVVDVPKNLCAKIPESVSDEEAAFTVLGAIALQGIRLIKPTLGETIVVTGLGLIGLLTVQLLRANGCRVLGVDFDENKLNLASKFGAEVVNLSKNQDPISISESFSRGRGVDGVIITASSQSNELIHQAAQMCRKRGRIVLVGVTGLNLSRDDFFQKELTFQVSASYGPGRYDPNYEEKGQDYPVGFVRWTEQRNFEAVLDMMDAGLLDVRQLISHKFDISKSIDAYEIISNNKPSLGILLKYPGIEIDASSHTLKLNIPSKNERNYKVEKNQKIKVSFIGSGNYASSVLIPAFKSTNVELLSVISKAGVSGIFAAKKFQFAETSTDSNRVFDDKESDAVVITSRHDTHSKFVLQGVKYGKHIFVEKPLCISLDELEEIKSKYNPSKLLMVGFNRRFSPQVQRMKDLLSSVNDTKSIVMTVNAGFIPLDHWTQDLEIGGGRIIGEACHFIDLLRFIIDKPITNHSFSRMKSPSNDTISINLIFLDGSIGTIHYFSNGSKSYPKETIEVFSSGKVLRLDNFRKLTGYGWKNFKKMNLFRQDKGQKACVKAFVDSIEQGLPSPIPFEEIIEVTKISIEIENS